MVNPEIKIKYLYHSGFRVETSKHIFIFDYYKGNVDMGDKDTYVFSSHGHPDHFNKEIFQWQKQKPNIKYILSDDISIKQKKGNIFVMSPYDEIKVDDVIIKAFGSTDLGVSFLIQFLGTNLFHAGDLNWWYWSQDVPEEIKRAEILFKKEIAKIKGESIDIAFFPVDPRLEHNYCVGADYFIQEISPKVLIPMHFGDNGETAKQYAEKMKDSPTRIIDIAEKGQELVLD
ncbi:MAG: hydrolase [Gracilibacter sp. BRH_c7a]|nr:MAG: hydrolase [Gracilibacter sp. BRH_c7a]